MKNIKSLTSLVLVLILCLSLAACAKNPAKADGSSKDLGLYFVTNANGSKSVVGKTGKAETGYAVDQKGNITKADGSLVISADDAEEFIYVSMVEFAQAEQKVSLDAQQTAGTVVKLEVKVSPEDATCKDVTFTSSNERILKIQGTEAIALSAGSVTVTAEAVGAKDKVPVSCAILVEGAQAGEDTHKPADNGSSSGTGSSTGASNSDSGNSGNGSSSSGSSSGGSSSSSGGSSSQPVHTHNWKPVYRTEEYPIYETKCYTICAACGQKFGVESTDEELGAHMKAHALAGESTRTYEKYEDVQVGTNTEQVLDHYQCSCGATKSA